jgi:hypothetical protein
MDIDKLFAKLSTQQKRAVNKLIRTLAGGKVKQSDFASICRSINRNTLKGIRVKRPPSAYIMFHSDRFPVHREAHPNAKLGDLAKMIGHDWKSLAPAKKALYVSKATESMRKMQQSDVESIT